MPRQSTRLLCTVGLAGWCGLPFNIHPLAVATPRQMTLVAGLRVFIPLWWMWRCFGYLACCRRDPWLDDVFLNDCPAFGCHGLADCRFWCVCSQRVLLPWTGWTFTSTSFCLCSAGWVLGCGMTSIHRVPSVGCHV